MSNREEIAMYILVRNDLRMSPGKVAAQVGHGVELALALGRRYYPQYTPTDSPCAKIILQASMAEMKEVFDQFNDNFIAKVIDEGRTEVEPGTMTVAAFVPCRRGIIMEDVKNLRLYR